MAEEGSTRNPTIPDDALVGSTASSDIAQKFIEFSSSTPKPPYLPKGFPWQNPPLVHRMLMRTMSFNQEFNIPVFSERILVNIYEIDPERLFADLFEEEDEEKLFLFFTLRGREYEYETQIHQAAGKGYWQYTSGADRALRGDPSRRIFGLCRCFQFIGQDYKADAPRFYLEEYRLADYGYMRPEVTGGFGDWVLCKLTKLELKPDAHVPKPMVTSPTINPPMENPPLYIPYLGEYYKKPPSSSQMISPSNIPANLCPTSKNPITPGALVNLTGPPKVCLILMYAISNRGDQIKGCSFPVVPNMIVSNIYEINPDELADFYGPNQDEEWFCFTIRSREYENNKILNRAVGDGYWFLEMGSSTAITTVESDGSPIGVRRTFEFYRGKDGAGVKTRWIMHEFRLNEPASECKVGDWVLCRIWNNEKALESGSQVVERDNKRKRV